MPARTASELKIEGRTLAVTNLQKVLYPAAAFTKGDVIRYYIDIAPALLPHLRDRALTMKRYPEGVGKFFFYEKNCPPYRPSWMKTAAVYSKRRGGMMHFCLVNNLASLVWLANLADLELHTSLARAPKVDRPTTMVFDLDPGEGTNILQCAQVAFWLREKFARLKLESFPKTSGSKGLQLYVPLNTPFTFEQTKVASRQIADAVQADHRDAVVTNMLKSLRKNKVLIDWSQNDDHKTTVCVYSLRATERPQVSTPLQWREVEQLARRGDPDAFRFSPDEAVARVKKHGDLFAPVLKLKQKIV
ncbi:MAG TPA: non-homologous end-joining DNA ligase [Opitutaceae bacterium]|nr:non-homologous end-joining DNA ligase [Opitutaceae bacterium]